MNASIKLQSRIFKFSKMLKILKNYLKKYYVKKIVKILEFSKKNGIYVKDPCQVYTCTKFQVDILKNARVLAF